MSKEIFELDTQYIGNLNKVIDNLEDLVFELLERVEYLEKRDSARGLSGIRIGGN